MILLLAESAKYSGLTSPDSTLASNRATLVPGDASQIEVDERPRICLKFGPREQRSTGGKASTTGGVM